MSHFDRRIPLESLCLGSALWMEDLLLMDTYVSDHRVRPDMP